MATQQGMFSRAAARLPLTPQERSLLAAFWSLVVTSLTNGLVAAGQALFLYSMQHSLAGYAWWPIIAFQGWNVLIAILMGIRKYMTAHADMAYAPIVSTATDVAIQIAQQQQKSLPQVDSQATVAMPAAPLVPDMDTVTGMTAIQSVK